MSLRLSELAALRLAREFVGGSEAAGGEEKTGEEKIGEEDREALEELVRQISGRAATAIGALLGGAAQLQVSVGEAPWARTPESVATIWRGAESETGVEIGLSAELAAAVKLRAEKQAAEASGSMTASATSDSGAESLPGADASGTSADDGKASGYRRLLDVGLGVKLRFGTRRMVLREVLALSTGSVVELDNKLNSPVDLLLDGRVIARGEVVVIDDKYGFRVTEVIDSPDGVSAQA
jgi:flagellar motor switch protein FliN